MTPIFLDNEDLSHISKVDYNNNPTVLNYLSYGIIDLAPWILIKRELLRLDIV